MQLPEHVRCEEYLHICIEIEVFTADKQALQKIIESFLKNVKTLSLHLKDGIDQKESQPYF
jgi:hypothetical protein